MICSVKFPNLFWSWHQHRLFLQILHIFAQFSPSLSSSWRCAKGEDIDCRRGTSERKDPISCRRAIVKFTIHFSFSFSVTVFRAVPHSKDTPWPCKTGLRKSGWKQHPARKKGTRQQVCAVVNSRFSSSLRKNGEWLFWARKITENVTSRAWIWKSWKKQFVGHESSKLLMVWGRVCVCSRGTDEMNKRADGAPIAAGLWTWKSWEIWENTNRWCRPMTAGTTVKARTLVSCLENVKTAKWMCLKDGRGGRTERKNGKWLSAPLRWR